MRIVIINGPNLNLLGRREVSIYGTKSMEQILVDIQRAYPEVYFEYRQSNHEGELIDWIQEVGLLKWNQEVYDGIILNAGGYTHTSVALRDAVACSQVPIVEVHISDISRRESFRQFSLLTDVCAHAIIGQGTDGYQQATEWLIEQNK
ncbi:MAG: 3-dehydroquinate dehydratase [Paludibacteraceae bacterium]|nr:3-dehydroquinate dehydratase [Paludibacteraceae bacterium]MBQ9143321.1 3-dehydroquinate dehydratase [Paludibacteraceae bacterium]